MPTTVSYQSQLGLGPHGEMGSAFGSAATHYLYHCLDQTDPKQNVRQNRQFWYTHHGIYLVRQTRDGKVKKEQLFLMI